MEISLFGSKPGAANRGALFAWAKYRSDDGVCGTSRADNHKASLLCALVIICIACTLFVTSARDEDFWWTDSASFALNGEMVRDYLISGLGRNPMAFASEWFLRYPALTISLYPPLFPVVEAIVFQIFGFSHDAAQATVTLFAILCGYGIHQLVRPVAGTLAGINAVILLFASPLMLWSRQIVMEVPALAFLLLAAAALIRYQAASQTKYLFAAVLLTLTAIYTKQATAFVAPAFAVALLADGGLPLLRRAHIWLALALGLAGLLPIIAFTILYDPDNFQIAFGAETGESEYARLSVSALLAYGRVLPANIGIVPLIGTAAYLGLVRLAGWSANERRLTVLMLAWFTIDYILISVTADFETRYATFLTAPPAVLTALFIS
jgi:4-amino-4-deoxy-L-arabinose transferase-like glycosyltransferase